jgi:hypothetical protein
MTKKRHDNGKRIKDWKRLRKLKRKQYHEEYIERLRHENQT